MSNESNEVSRTLIDGVSAWLKESALGSPDLETIVTETCDRLSAVGIPLKRVHLSFSMLHPLYAALSFTWVRGEGVQLGNYQRVDEDSPPPLFATSPYYQLVSKNLSHLRRRIDRSTPSEFPVFDDLKPLGITDYLAFTQSFGIGEAPGRGMMGSWTTDRAGGFSDEMIKALLHIQSNFAVTALMAVSSQLADNMLTTYLGGSAGKRVQSGQIQRGDGETIRAALVMVDMRNSTALAESAGRQGYIDTLNQFFDAVAEPFNRDGGEILSFVGDGFLAVYPCERHKAPSQVAARAAMSAARQAVARMTEMNQLRTSEGQEPIGFGIGLHVGNVMFGNVGLKDRLAFSAFGSAVNEVQRLESLTKKFSTPVVASEIFQDYCGGDWQAQGEEELRGLTEKLSVFLPGPQNLASDGTTGMTSGSGKSRSEAEEIMLLLQDKQGKKSRAPSRRVH